MRRFSCAGLVATAALIAVPSGATGATTTVGQLHPNPGATTCGNAQPFDQLQLSVTDGAPYTVPADGTITSWSHNATADVAPGTEHEIKFKVFRNVSGDEYQAVANDERPLNEGALNTFTTSIPVQAGDIIGFNDGEDSLACRFTAGGEVRVRPGDLADGASGAFTAGTSGVRLNISALLETPNPLTGSCGGEPATIFGTPESDDLTGTPERDVITGLGGKDEISGLGGKDLICGGKARDTLRGGKGKDKLLGQAGKDRLSGGAGRDVCKGGKKDDTAKKCEVEKSI